MYRRKSVTTLGIFKSLRIRICIALQGTQRMETSFANMVRVDGRPEPAEYDNFGVVSLNLALRGETKQRLSEPLPDYPTNNDQVGCVTTFKEGLNQSKATSGYQGVHTASAAEQQLRQSSLQEPLPDYPTYGLQNLEIFGLKFSRSEKKSNVLCIEDDPKYKAMGRKKNKFNIKKICKYFIWIMIFLAISGIAALATISNQKTERVEYLTNGFPGMLKSQDEKIRAVKDMIKGMFEDLKRNLTKTKEDSSTVYSTDFLTNVTSTPVDPPDERCKNTTDKPCVSGNDCFNLCNGNFQLCDNCSMYVTCSHGHLNILPCNNNKISPTTNLVWDDTSKQCKHVSSTCPPKQR